MSYIRLIRHLSDKFRTTFRAILQKNNCDQLFLCMAKGTFKSCTTSVFVGDTSCETTVSNNLEVATGGVL